MPNFQQIIFSGTPQRVAAIARGALYRDDINEICRMTPAPAAQRPRLRQFPGQFARMVPASSARLPWRASRDPYRIWVAEVMLQQTRIAAVISFTTAFSQLPHCRIAGLRAPSGCPEILGGPRLLQPRAQPAQRREKSRRRPRRKIPSRIRRRPRLARYWPLHRRGCPQHRVRCSLRRP